MHSSPTSLSSARHRRDLAEWVVFIFAATTFSAFVAYVLLTDHTAVRTREQDRLQVQARVIDENLSRQFDGLAKTLSSLSEDFSAQGTPPESMASTSRRFTSLTTISPGIRTLLLIDSTGTVVASSRPELLGLAVGHREYVATPRGHADRSIVYISRPFYSTTGAWVINVSKILTGRQGEFAGLVTAALDSDYFNVVLRSVLYAPDMRTTLVHGAGELFLSMPANPRLLGLNVAVPGSFFSRHMESGKPGTLLTGEVAATGEHRMVATRTIRAGLNIDHPLVVHVGREMAAIYAAWNRQALLWGVTSAVLIAAMAIALGLAQRRRHALDRVKASAAQERADSDQRLRAIANHVPALISHFDRHQVCTFTNPYCGEVYGMDHRSMVGLSVPEVRGEVEYAKLKPHIDRVLAGEASSFESHTQINGVERVLQQNYIPDFAPDGSVQGFYSISHDVTALKQVQQQLAALARIDPLTGIPNRRFFDERLPEAIARCRRDQRPTALLMLDVDEFKSINDSRGHVTGDAVLKEFALRLKDVVRETDTTARLAGDEFVVILEGLRSVDEAGLIAQKIVDAMHLPMKLNGESIAISTSIGVAVTGLTAESAQVLLARADEALYRAKHAGRNTYVVAA